MVAALALGLLALPVSDVVQDSSKDAAEAHVATGGVKAKMEKLSGRTYRGYVTAWINNTEGTEFDGETHIQERQLVAYMGVAKKKKGPYKIASGSLVIEQWNDDYESGPMRPRITCHRGTWVRAVGVHRVRAWTTIELWNGTHIPVGGVQQHEDVSQSKPRKCN